MARPLKLHHDAYWWLVLTSGMKTDPERLEQGDIHLTHGLQHSQAHPLGLRYQGGESICTHYS